MAKMEDEELEDEEVARRAAAVGTDRPIVNDIECGVEQEMMIGEEEADVGEYFGNNQRYAPKNSS